MRKLRDAVLFAYLRVLAFLRDRRDPAPARYCSMCGSASTLSRWTWWRIERRDEEVPCVDCFARPRLWVKARPQ